jgi:two-component system, OmpR family, phosphate regulon sensor histidine kinase PhoR
MPREYFGCLGVAVATWAPVAAILGALQAVGLLTGASAAAAAAAALTVAMLIALAFAASLAGLRRMIERMGAIERPGEGNGPIGAAAAPLVGRALWPGLMRLRGIYDSRLIQAETRLAAAEAVIAAIPDPLLLIDSRRRIVRANEAAAVLIGRRAEPGDLAGALRNPALLSAVDSLLRGEAAGGPEHNPGHVPGRSIEFNLSGMTDRVLRAHLARIDGPALDGAVALLILDDITALKRTEQMRADFIANAGHELKTPLAALIGFIETLLGPAHDDAAARERFLAIMHEQARRMARLVDDLLSLSRIELNEHVAPTGRVALAPVIEEVARGLELRAAERNIRIVPLLPPDLPEVQGDRDEMVQVFQNLLDNAVKYARPHSEITVTGSVGRGSEPSPVRVAVADQGEGIPGEHIPRLTERFYRVDTARSRELGGTGLGLAIVKHLVNRHRGRLEITSRLGQGSTFTVCLRAAESRAVSSNRNATVISQP